MNIIVTGASRGIGRALVSHFSNTGHKIIAISRNHQELEVLAEDCLNNHPDSLILPYPFDLGDLSKDRSEFVSFVKKHFGQLDILINNAGYLVSKPFAEMNPEEIEHHLLINYTAPFLLIQAVLPLLLLSRNSHVINIGSMGGLQGTKKFPGLSAYSSSKAALAVLTECLAEEYQSQGIRFNYLALGAVQTEMLEEAFPGFKTPMGAEEMASFIADFALQGNRYFNGKLLPVSTGTP